MEKKLESLYGQIKAEFPEHTAQIGLIRSEYGDKPQWFIKLEGEVKDCPCCHQGTRSEISVWSEPTFESAFAKIKEMVKEDGGI